VTFEIEGNAKPKKNMTAKSDEKCGTSPWYVDTLGAAGLPLQKNEDYAPPASCDVKDHRRTSIRDQIAVNPGN
jgi:hypothetical protein